MALVSEDEVFQALQDLVAAGEYLDQIPGVPVPSTSGGGAFRATPYGQYRRIYHRGSTEYLQARDKGLAGPLPAAPFPASEEAVQAAECILGLPLPPLLRRLYLEVGNGGFGPGYGLLELPCNSKDASRKWSSFPPSLFPVCAWGCGIYSFTDCSSREGKMRGWDPNPGPVGVEALYPQSLDLAGRLGRWIECTLYQPCPTRPELGGVPLQPTVRDR